MRLSSLLLLFTLLNLDLFAQKSIKCLFNDLKKDEKSFAISVPGWLVKTGLNYASNHTEENDRLLFEKFKDVIKKVRVLVIDGTEKDHTESFEHFYSKCGKDKLELYASVKEEKNKINVYVEEKDDIIKNFFLTVKGEKEIVLLHIKAELPMKLFKDTDFSFHKNKISTNNEN